MKCCRKLSTWGPRRLLGRNASPGADATDTDTVVTGYTFITSRAHTVSRFLAVLSGTSSSLLMLCLLRKRRSSLLISLPFSPFISAPFSLLFRQPPHICFLPLFMNVPSSPHTSSHMFGHHPATGQLAGRNVPRGTQDLRALRLWQSCRQWRAQPWSCMDAAPG